MNKRPRPLLWRLGVPLALVQMAVFVGLAVFAWSHIKQVHSKNLRGDMQATSNELAAHYRPMLEGSVDQQTVQRAAAADGQRLAKRITVIAADGTVIADSVMNPADITNTLSRDEVAAALRDGSGWSTRTAADQDAPFLFVAHRVDANGAAIGIVRVASTLEGFQAEAMTAIRTLLIACLVSILLTLSIIYIADHRLSLEAEALAGRAERFGEGDFSKQSTMQSSSGLSSLSDALNRMASRLEDRVEDLQLQQQQQRAILQSMSNAVLAVDSEQRIVMVNRAAEQLLGLRSNAVQSRLLQEVIRQPELHGFVRRALEDPTPQQMELRLLGDPTVVVQATSGPLTTADDELAGVLLVLNDVTELRRLESLRSDFAANVSHELRTPITNLKGYIETLLEVGTSDYQQTQKFLKIIQQNIERLSAIVNDVMALTELERPRIGGKDRGKERLERVPSSLNAIISNVLDQFRSRAAEKNVVLKSLVSTDLRANVQPRLLEQAIGNLVANAIAYSPQDTTVTIEATESGDEIEIAVIDEGPGIEAEHLPRLWERFYRVDQARSRDAGGTGLGLAIVKHIALSHGGRVEVKSVIGAGSRFVIVLPIS